MAQGSVATEALSTTDDQVLMKPSQVPYHGKDRSAIRKVGAPDNLVDALRGQCVALKKQAGIPSGSFLG